MDSEKMHVAADNLFKFEYGAKVKELDDLIESAKKLLSVHEIINKSYLQFVGKALLVSLLTFPVILSSLVFNNADSITLLHYSFSTENKYVFPICIGLMVVNFSLYLWVRSKDENQRLVDKKQWLVENRIAVTKLAEVFKESDIFLQELAVINHYMNKVSEQLAGAENWLDENKFLPIESDRKSQTRRTEEYQPFTDEQLSKLKPHILKRIEPVLEADSVLRELNNTLKQHRESVKKYSVVFSELEKANESMKKAVRELLPEADVVKLARRKRWFESCLQVIDGVTVHARSEMESHGSKTDRNRCKESLRDELIEIKGKELEPLHKVVDHHIKRFIKNLYHILNQKAERTLIMRDLEDAYNAVKESGQTKFFEIQLPWLSFGICLFLLLHLWQLQSV